MKIGTNWKIESDELNVILFKRQRHTWRAEAYFSTVRNALHYLINTEINRTELKDLKTVNDKVGELHQLIENLSPNARLAITLQEANETLDEKKCFEHNTRLCIMSCKTEGYVIYCVNRELFYVGSASPPEVGERMK
jgi:hypothetical protein